jgi:SAM-dependent methyltransferase
MKESEDTNRGGAGSSQAQPPAGAWSSEAVCASQRDFSHVGNFTDYMETVYCLLEAKMPGGKILDIPAGNGLLAARLRQRGQVVVCCDINRERPDYVLADMNEPLPFAEGEFDAVVCMEGLEHTLNPAALIGELCRVTRPGGRIILTVPNIQNVFSRLKFLCMGCFYQFSPWGSIPRPRGEKKDRGHVSSLTYLQLRYLFDYNGARLSAVRGDRWKKKWLIPLMLPALALGRVWARVELSRQKTVLAEDCRAMLRDLFSAPALFSRSLVLVFQKT